MKVSVIPLDFRTLAEDWQRLLPDCGTNTIFSTPRWQGVWWQQFGQGKDLLLLSVVHDGRLIGIAPLMRVGGTISFIGDHEVCDYLDFVVLRGGEEVFFPALLDYLVLQDWTRLDLHAIPDYSRTISLLPAMAQARGYSVTLEVEGVCPGLALAGTWDDYLSSLSKKARHELRRKLRRLNASDNVRSYALSHDDLSADMSDFLHLHRVSREDKAHFMNSEMEAFFRKETATLAEAGCFRLYFMEIDGKRVSSAICFDYADEFLLYNSGYDPAYSGLSVGLLLKVFCLREAIESGKRRFDFLRGSERYKYELGGTDSLVRRCLITREASRS
ncbi:MAG: GNAT family N-acetyltransferase [Chloroflexi bacterium]|nr:GNAT family N-acetyltransferase [Chloroflexota bacterium]